MDSSSLFLKHGSYEFVKFLAQKRTYILVKTNDGKNYLHIAALYGHLNLCKILLDKYNFVDMADNDGWTGFHYSVRNGSYELFSFFHNMGSDLYQRTNHGKNCLHIAALYGHLNLCKN